MYLMYILKQERDGETSKGRVRGVLGDGIGAGWALGGAGGKVTCPLLSLSCEWDTRVSHGSALPQTMQIPYK